MFWVIVFLIAFYVFLKLSRGVTRSSTCLVGKTALITGANSGIGYQTALNLASRGCKVIMADVADMEESRDNIKKYTNNPNIFTQKLDLSSLKSVRDFASKILQNEEKLDILINNAGVGTCQNNRTEDGLHPLMQINYFGHFLLTHLLIDLLKKSAPSRIVFTSSLLAFTNWLTVENLNFDDKTDGFLEKLFSYSNSKFALMIASDIFAEKLRGTGVTANCIHPGVVNTPIFTNSYSIIRNVFVNIYIRSYLLMFSKDAWEGSQTLVHAAVSKKLEKTTGRYFVNCRPFIKPPMAYNRSFCQNIWEASETYVGLTPEENLLGITPI